LAIGHWSDLDQAYLEIFGTHPDAPRLVPDAISFGFGFTTAHATLVRP
jgi:hypothetical protein